jgi:hypothetical protein
VTVSVLVVVLLLLLVVAMCLYSRAGADGAWIAI